MKQENTLELIKKKEATTKKNKKYWWLTLKDPESGATRDISLWDYDKGEELTPGFLYEVETETSGQYTNILNIEPTNKPAEVTEERILTDEAKEILWPKESSKTVLPTKEEPIKIGGIPFPDIFSKGKPSDHPSFWGQCLNLAHARFDRQYPDMEPDKFLEGLKVLHAIYLKKLK